MATIKILSGKETVKILNWIRSGRTLLDILLQHQVPVKHECGGMCTCSTCHIYIKSGMQYLEAKSTREEHFLRKVHYPTPESRLSCQCLLLDNKAIVEISIPDPVVI